MILNIEDEFSCIDKIVQCVNGNADDCNISSLKKLLKDENDVKIILSKTDLLVNIIFGQEG